MIAAGGIADGRGLAAALALGAGAAQLGTAFVASPEGAAPAFYREALAGADAERTTITRAFTGRPARTLRNRTTAAIGAQLRLPGPDVPHRPPAGRRPGVRPDVGGTGSRSGARAPGCRGRDHRRGDRRAPARGTRRASRACASLALSTEAVESTTGRSRRRRGEAPGMHRYGPKGSKMSAVCASLLASRWCSGALFVHPGKCPGGMPGESGFGSEICRSDTQPKHRQETRHGGARARAPRPVAGARPRLRLPSFPSRRACWTRPPTR